MESNTDRIEKELVLRAPRTRVWRALTDAKEFGRWFGVRLEGPFVAGQVVRGQITTPGYDHLPFEALVERIEPERLFALRWHPYAIEVGVDYSHEPTTLVEFELREVGDATLLRVVESGFSQLPPERRSPAFRSNSEGWAIQLESIAQYVRAAA